MRESTLLKRQYKTRLRIGIGPFGMAIATRDGKKKNLFLLRQLQFASWFFFGELVVGGRQSDDGY